LCAGAITAGCFAMLLSNLKRLFVVVELSGLVVNKS